MSRLDVIDEPRPETIEFRAPGADDGPDMWALARHVGLDENSPYAYAMWGEYFAATSLVARDDADRLVGFVTGFAPDERRDTTFVWQIGVVEAARGLGIAGRLLDELAATSGCTYVEATVTPSNVASATLFRRFGERHGAPVEESPLFTEKHFPGDSHEAEVRFRVGPLG